MASIEIVFAFIILVIIIVAVEFFAFSYMFSVLTPYKSNISQILSHSLGISSCQLPSMYILVWDNSTSVFFLKDMYFIAYLKIISKTNMKEMGVSPVFFQHFYRFRLMFRSFIHFELILLYSIRIEFSFSHLLVNTWFYDTVYWKGYSSLFVLWHLYECLVSICACIMFMFSILFRWMSACQWVPIVWILWFRRIFCNYRVWCLWIFLLLFLFLKNRLF